MPSQPRMSRQSQSGWRMRSSVCLSRSIRVPPVLSRERTDTIRGRPSFDLPRPRHGLSSIRKIRRVGVAGLPGLAGQGVFFSAIAFCFFQIITAAFSPLSSIVLRSVHVGFSCF